MSSGIEQWLFGTEIEIKTKVTEGDDDQDKYTEEEKHPEGGDPVIEPRDGDMNPQNTMSFDDFMDNFENENRALNKFSHLYDDALKLHRYVNKYGVDKGFITFCNSNHELESLLHIALPSVESFSEVGSSDSKISFDVRAGLEAFISNLWDKIKSIANGLFNRLTDFVDYLRRKFMKTEKLVNYYASLSGRNLRDKVNLSDIQFKIFTPEEFRLKLSVYSDTELYSKIGQLCREFMNTNSAQELEILTKKAIGIEEQYYLSLRKAGAESRLFSNPKQRSPQAKVSLARWTRGDVDWALQGVAQSNRVLHNVYNQINSLRHELIMWQNDAKAREAAYKHYSSEDHYSSSYGPVSAEASGTVRDDVSATLVIRKKTLVTITKLISFISHYARDLAFIISEMLRTVSLRLRYGTVGGDKIGVEPQTSYREAQYDHNW